MIHDFFKDGRPHNGITYEQFLNAIKVKVERLSTNMDAVTDHDEFLKLNFQRSQRIYKTYTVSPELRKLLSGINEPQLWMVITEDWCGDSAQILPYIEKITEVNPDIQLRIIYRDQNPDIMDLYLTNGSMRSIPKLVAFDREGNELFQWGPRPREAQDLVNQLKAEGYSKDQFIEQLHLWYGRNRGKAIEFEFKKILTDLSNDSEEFLDRPSISNQF